MKKGFCITAAAWLVTAACPALASGQGEKGPVKALIEMGAAVRHDLPFKSVYRSFLDDQFNPGQEKVLRVWIESTWKGGKAGLEHLPKLPDLHGVSFQSGSEQSDWYRILLKLPRLRQFSSFGPSVDDRCCAYLSSCEELDTLSLMGSMITPAGMKKLKGLKKLEWVSFSSAAKLCNAGFAHLPVKNLIYLNLQDTGVTGDGIASLSEAKHLQFLTLSGEAHVETGSNEVRRVDAGLKHLVKLTNLKRLRVGGMRVDEADMKEILRQSKHLQEIDADRGAYTREGWVEGSDLAERVKKLGELKKKLQKSK